MPQAFSLTDNPPSINFMEVKLERADATNTSPSQDGDNWATLKQSNDYLIGNRKYLIIVNGRVGGNSANKLFSFRVTQDHDGSIITPVMTREPKNYSVSHSYCAAEIITPSVNTKINFEAMSHDAAGWAKLSYLRIVALDITDLREGIDYFHSVDSTAEEHGAVYVPRNTYIIDDDSTGVPSEQIAEVGDGYAQATGDWLILNTAVIDVDFIDGNSHGMKVKHGNGTEGRGGGVSYSASLRQETQEEGEDTDEIALMFLAYPQSVTAAYLGSRFQIYTCDPVGANSPNSYVSSTLIGLNMSRFKDVKSEHDTSTTTSTDDPVVEITMKTWSDQPSNDGKAFFIGCGICDVNDGGANYWTGLDQDDKDAFNMGGLGQTNAWAGRTNDTTDEPSFVAMGIVDLDSSSTHEYKWQLIKDTTVSSSYQHTGYAMFSLTYNYEDFYDEKVETVKIGEVRRRRSSPTIPTIG
jgi:hypothetical protein